MVNNNIKKVSFEFATNEMRQNGDNIRSWAQQSDNPLIQAICIEIIEVAGGK